MFGLFQANIPIGHRLWLSLIALVIAGSLASTPLAQVDQDPVAFVVDLLLLYGYTSMIEVGLLIAPFFLVGIIEMMIVEHSSKKKQRFYRETEALDPLMDRVFTFLSPIAFVVAVILAVSRFGDVPSRNWGGVGLFLYLVAEVIDWQVLQPKGYHYLELRRLGDNTLEARLSTSDTEQTLQSQAHWMQTLAYLTDNDWELLEVSYEEPPTIAGVLPAPPFEPKNTVLQRVALLRRSYHRSVVPKEWREAFASLIARGLDWLGRAIRGVRNLTGHSYKAIRDFIGDSSHRVQVAKAMWKAIWSPALQLMELSRSILSIIRGSK